ncbi:hypothetical protein H8959_022642 [Pygathrix nigripes]
MLGVSILANVFLGRARNIVTVERKGTPLCDSPFNLPFSALLLAFLGSLSCCSRPKLSPCCKVTLFLPQPLRSDLTCPAKMNPCLRIGIIRLSLVTTSRAPCNPGNTARPRIVVLRLVCGAKA